MNDGMKALRRLYGRFLAIEQNSLVRYVRAAENAGTKKSVSDRAIREAYDAYYRPTFFTFLRDLKLLAYAPDVFAFVKAVGKDSEYAAAFVELFEQTGIARFSENGKVVPLEKSIFRMLVRPQSALQIRKKVERTIGRKMGLHAPVTDLFFGKEAIGTKHEFDQLPVSQGSAIFEVEKILENLPLHGPFLFVGDDDGISLLLGLANPRISSIVVDADRHVLSAIERTARTYRLDIKTKLADVTKRSTLAEPVVGFLCNPSYTHKGVEMFVRYGVGALGEDGGIGIVVVGDEAIGRRFLLLQDFFAKNRLVLQELCKGRIEYPFLELHDFDRAIAENFFSAGIAKEKVIASCRLGASVYVFDYLPHGVEVPKRKQAIYTYL